MENMTSECQGTNTAEATQSDINPFRLLQQHRDERVSLCAQWSPPERRQRPPPRSRFSVERLELHVAHANLCNDMDDVPSRWETPTCPPRAEDPREHPIHDARATLFITFDAAANGRGAPALYTIWAGPVAKVATRPLCRTALSRSCHARSQLGPRPLTGNDAGRRT